VPIRGYSVGWDDTGHLVLDRDCVAVTLLGLIPGRKCVSSDTGGRGDDTWLDSIGAGFVMQCAIARYRLPGIATVKLSVANLIEFI
jgi:hypothetical protein